MSWLVASIFAACDGVDEAPAPRPHVDSAAPADLVTLGGPGLALTFEGEAPKSVIVYQVDTLRRDRLPWHGGPHDTYPTLTAMDEHLVVVDLNFTVGSWTIPSSASQFSGLDQPRTRMVTSSGRAVDSGAVLGPGTVNEVFQAAGYSTALITGNGLLSEENGFWQGVDHAEVVLEEPYNSGQLARATEAWLGTVSPETPFYLHLQPMDAHEPFNGTDFVGTFVDPADLPFELTTPGQIAKARLALDALADDPVAQAAMVEAIRSTYDEELLQTDRALSEIFASLVANGRLEDTLLILTADHGEVIADRVNDEWRFEHSDSVRPELVHIPLVFYNPRLVGERIDDCIVQNVDWMPTIAGMLGVGGVPPGIDGADVTQTCRPWAVSATYAWNAQTGENAMDAAVVYNSTSAVRGSCRDGGYRFTGYDHLTDPTELQPLEVGALPHGPAMQTHLEEYLQRAADTWAGASCR
ncbi:hypothetical protein LBMAG42_51710 [Deltaproteobacteria bacterium]|nr:hypothetical protein LBMAG42_51710 [Deltaproteobacteria bacterium]